MWLSPDVGDPVGITDGVRATGAPAINVTAGEAPGDGSGGLKAQTARPRLASNTTAASRLMRSYLDKSAS